MKEIFTVLFVIVFALSASSVVFADTLIPPEHPVIQDGWYYYSATTLIKVPEKKYNEMGAWLKVIHKDGSYSLSEFKIDCRENKFSPMQNLKYSSKGKLQSAWFSPSEDLRTIPPQTMGEVIHDVVCDIA